MLTNARTFVRGLSGISSKIHIWPTWSLTPSDSIVITSPTCTVMRTRRIGAGLQKRKKRYLSRGSARTLTDRLFFSVSAFPSPSKAFDTSLPVQVRFSLHDGLPPAKHIFAREKEKKNRTQKSFCINLKMASLNDLVPSGVVTGDDLLTLLEHARANGYAIPAVNCTRYVTTFFTF